MVPLERPLVTRVTALRSVPLVLVDVETRQGVVGHAYLVAYLQESLPLFREAVSLVGSRLQGEVLPQPGQFHALRESFTLLGKEGLMAMALSGLDMACWDAVAKEAGEPLWRHLGGREASVPAYNSNGLGLEPPAHLLEQLPRLLDRGFRAVKLRLGRSRLDEDLEAIVEVQAALPPGVGLMGDFNQCLAPDTAVSIAERVDPRRLLWVEEPIAYDDLPGNARVAAAMRTPLQLGENFYGARMMQLALDARACDLVMPDAQRIGGVSGWLEAAALAERYRVPMSSHLFPEVSAHLLRVTPTAHWLEYVNWAEPILMEPLCIEGGCAFPADAPGAGIEWDERAVERFAVRR